MKVLNYFVILTIFCCVCCQEDKNVSKVDEQLEESGESSSREAKQLRDPAEHGGWRAVENRQWQNSDEWVPKETLPIVSTEITDKPIPRRRRIRKRKRRPLIIVNSQESVEYPHRRRRIRPHTLEDVNDSWAEIEEESARRPYNRRRIVPVYSPEVQSEESIELKPPSAVLQFEEETNQSRKPQRTYEKVRDPFTALEEVEAKARLKKQQEEQNKDETTTVANLKALLKQSGGTLSLSELLQQKNLSLNDLLKGKEQAISVLTEKAQTNIESTSMPTNSDEFESIESKPKVIEISTTEEVKIEENPKSETQNKILYLENVTKSTNRNYEVSDDSLEKFTSKGTADFQSKIPQRNEFERKVITTIKSYEVITEPTTERRIFVPSHSKYYTSFNYKPDMNKKVAEAVIKPTVRVFSTTKVQTTPTTTTTTNKNLSNKYLDFRSKYVSLKPKIKTLPITSAKLHRLNTKQPNSTKEPATTTPIPLQAFKIDVKDLFGISQITNGTEAKPKEDGPLKMSINIETFMKKPIIDKEAVMHQTFKKDLMKDLENSANEVTTDIKDDIEISTKYFEKSKPLSAREEIMELLKEHMSRQNLSRILELRNMTIEELVAQRERGSSQLHLADIFHNQTREPEPPSEPYVGHINGLPPLFDRKPKTIPNPIQINEGPPGSKYFASVIDLKPLQLNSDGPAEPVEGVEPQIQVVPAAPREKYTVTSFPTYKIEMEKIIKQNQPPPFQLSVWKSLYPNLYTGNSDNTHTVDELDPLKSTKIEDVLQHEVHRVEDIENAISDAVNDKLNIDVKENNYEDDYIQLPSGVKSAIIASAAIVGISLLVFLTIFIIFKWSHKQKKKRLCYSDTLSCSRIKSPILETRPRRTIRTIMSETLGRKKKYLNVYPQSMSDYIWENDKKPFQ